MIVFGRKRPTPPQRRKSHDLVIAFGLFMASLLDPKTKVQTEQVDRFKKGERTEPGRENQ